MIEMTKKKATKNERKLLKQRLVKLGRVKPCLGSLAGTGAHPVT